MQMELTNELLNDANRDGDNLRCVVLGRMFALSDALGTGMDDTVIGRMKALQVAYKEAQATIAKEKGW